MQIKFCPSPLTKHQALPITKSNLKSLLWSVYTIHALVPDHFSNLFSYHPLCSLCFSCAGVVLQVESSLLVHFGSCCQACSSPRHSLTSFRSISSHSSPLPYFIFCFNEHLPLPNHILFCLFSPLHQNRGQDFWFAHCYICHIVGFQGIFVE